MSADLKDKLKRPELLRSLCMIHGMWMDAEDGTTKPVSNPYSHDVLTHVPNMGEQETEYAIKVADGVFQSAWSKTTPRERAVLLRKWHDLILENKEDVALILSSEQGKPLKEALTEVAYAAAFLHWFAAEAERTDGSIIASTKPHQRITVIKQPVGVVAAITPWNFPAAMITRKVAPAIAAGCTVVLKPAMETPLTALALAYLAIEANIPGGVFNVITGDAPTIGKALCDSPVVRKLSFTGSTAVGKLLYKQSADTVKKISLELGGNAPFIIFADADLEKACEGLMASKYRNAGQTCVCANRIMVESSILKNFIKSITPRIEKLKCGNGLDESCDIGPLIDERAVEKVEKLLKDATSKGAKILLGGKRLSKDNTLFAPTLITGITSEMDIFHEEIFGPILAVTEFKSEEEAIEMANSSQYGLAAYFFTQDFRRIWRMGEALEYGMVGANEGLMSTEVAPFGGIKQSGIGREGSHDGMDEFLEKKYICWGDIQ